MPLRSDKSFLRSMPHCFAPWAPSRVQNGVQFSTCGSNIDPTDRSQLYDGIHPAPRGLEILFSCLAPQVQAAVAQSPC